MIRLNQYIQPSQFNLSKCKINALVYFIGLLINKKHGYLIMTDQIQSIFFSKESISNLNKIILDQCGLTNLTRDGKQEVVQILVKHMKQTYKKINLSSVTNANFDSIFKQFKSLCLKQTLDEIKRSNIFSDFSQSASDLKFKRDFQSNPTPGNRIMDRPDTTKKYIQSMPSAAVSSVPSNAPPQNNWSGSLDQAFSPLIPTEWVASTRTDEIDNVTARMDEMQQQRQTELSNQNARPKTPDYIKPTKVSDKRGQSQTQSQSQSRSQTRSQTQTQSQPITKTDFKLAPQSEFNQGFQGLSNDTTDGDLFSIDNINRPLIDPSIKFDEDDDPSKFEEKLKKLQSDREAVKSLIPNNPSGKINFTSDDFSKQAELLQSQFPQQNQQFPQQNQQTQQFPQQNQHIPQQFQTQQTQQFPQQTQQNQQFPQQTQQFPQQTQQFQTQQNQQFPQQTQQNQQIRNQQNQQIRNQQNQHIPQQNQYEQSLGISNYTPLINPMDKPNIEIDKMQELRTQIASEFDILKIKGETIEIKETALKLKEIEILRKDAELNQLIKQYEHLYRLRHIQLDVTDVNNKSKYIWHMNPIDYVTCIKLVNFYIPHPRYNIDANTNGSFHIKLNSSKLSVTISTGKYTIDELLVKLTQLLNMELNKIFPDKLINLELNNQDKVVIKTNNPTDIITVISTALSKNNLGFTSQTEHSDQTELDQSNQMVQTDQMIRMHPICCATNVWDLRIDNRIYLYLSNLSDNPFSILYPGQQSMAQFNFQEPFSISKLEIVFKDSNNNVCDFYNLPHNLSFIIDTIQPSF
jgi:hypothetical protein